MIVTAAALLGCGDDGESATDLPAASTTPTPEVTAESTATPTATATGTPSATPAPTEEGGDEEGNRTELAFELRASTIEPDRVEVPAFLGLRIRLRNSSGELRALSLDGRPLVAIAPQREQTLEVEGLQPGRHTLAAGAIRTTILAVRAGG